MAKSTKCPQCGSKRIAPVLYGEPTFEDYLYKKRGIAVIGGETIEVGSPSFACLACGHKFGAAITPVKEDEPTDDGTSE